MAYSLLAILVVGAAVLARMTWYRSRSQRTVRERKRDNVRAQNRREQYQREQTED